MTTESGFRYWSSIDQVRDTFCKVDGWPVAADQKFVHLAGMAARSHPATVGSEVISYEFDSFIYSYLRRLEYQFDRTTTLSNGGPNFATAAFGSPFVHLRRHTGAMDFADLQDVIERTYGDRDHERGIPATVAWLCEEVGELAQAVRKGTRDQQIAEFADVVAWVATLANQVGIDLNEAAGRYAAGCPKCSAIPCSCP